MVSSASDWSAAWRKASRAITFVFEHQNRELDNYAEYIENDFAAKHPGAHQRIILFDVAVPSRGTGAVYTSLSVPGSLDASKKRRLTWIFEGGVGGLIGGYLFGLHLSTALALLIPATTPSAALSYKPFLVVWALSATIATIFASRYRYVAYTFFGVSGGTFTSLAFCVIIHPSLPPRVILTLTFLVLFLILSLVFAMIPRLSNIFLRPFLRICTASTGAFGVVMSIALLLNPQETSWANVWERLWVKDGDRWGNGREQGLSAAFWIFLLLGISGDWAFHRWIGECPDDKWDDYLAHYAANLPNQPNRAGTFQPFNSFWDRLFSSASTTHKLPFLQSSIKKDKKDILFPSDVDFKAHQAFPFDASVGKLSKREKVTDEENHFLTLSGGHLKKKKRNDLTRGRKPVKFGADLSSDSDSEDDDDATGSKDTSVVVSSPTIQPKNPNLADPPPKPIRPTPARSFSSSAATLVERGKVAAKPRRETLADLDYEKEIEAVKDKLGRNGAAVTADGGGGGLEVEYSDYEEEEKDVTTTLKNSRGSGGGERWSPAFLTRHSPLSSGSSPPPPPRAQILPGAIPVPATPSLIKAMDRIAVAQRDAYGITAAAATATATPALDPAPSSPGSTHDRDVISMDRKQRETTTTTTTTGGLRWEEFWREVSAKARS